MSRRKMVLAPETPEERAQRLAMLSNVAWREGQRDRERGAELRKDRYLDAGHQARYEAGFRGDP